MHPLHPFSPLAKLCVFPAAPAYAAGMLGNLRPTVGGPWAALLAELPPETIFNEHYVWLAVVVMVLAVLAFLGLVKFRDAAVREIKSALASEAAKPEINVRSPIQIEHVEQFVSLRDFNAKFGDIDKRFIAIEQQIAGQVKRTEDYMHSMRHEIRNELQSLRLAADESRQAALASVSKAHGRVDGVAGTVAKVQQAVESLDGVMEQVGRLDGKVEAMSSSLAEIRQLLLSRPHFPQ